MRGIRGRAGGSIVSLAGKLSNSWSHGHRGRLALECGMLCFFGRRCLIVRDRLLDRRVHESIRRPRRCAFFENGLPCLAGKGVFFTRRCEPHPAADDGDACRHGERSPPRTTRAPGRRACKRASTALFPIENFKYARVEPGRGRLERNRRKLPRPLQAHEFLRTAVAAFDVPKNRLGHGVSLIEDERNEVFIARCAFDR